MCSNMEMYKKLSCSPCLFGLCDESLLEVKSRLDLRARIGKVVKNLKTSFKIF